MSKGDWGAILAIGLIMLGGNAEAHSKHHQRPSANHRNDPPAPAALIIHEADSDIVGTDAPKGCQGTNHPDKPCDAVSAKASEDQASYALGQTIAAWFGVGIGIGTLIAAGFAAKFARDAAVYTKLSAKHARRSANFSLKQLELAREEFVATHRPRLRFRYATPEQLGADKPVKVSILVSNVGDSPLRIFRIDANCAIFGKEGQIYKTDGVAKDYESGDLLPGQQMGIPWECASIFNSNQMPAIAKGLADFRLYGAILYKDGNGTVRVTSIMRKWDFRRGVFVSIPEDESAQSQDYED